MQRARGAWLASCGLLLVSLGVFSAYYGGPALLHKMIIDSVILKDDSEALRRWTVVPQPLSFYTYLFHVENPDQVAEGAKPIVTEKGPYVYDQFRERVDLQFHDKDDTVSYIDKTIYRFNQNKSGCRSENDMVTILHAPILGTGLMLRQIMPMALSIFDEAIPGLFPEAKNAFLTAKVKDILFDGVLVNCSYPLTKYPEGMVCQGMRSKAPVMFRRDGSNFYFSMLNHMNGTDTKHRVRIRRGQRDPRDLGRIVQFGNGSLLDSWRAGTPCNMINGTDTTIFKPFVQAQEKIPIFVSGSCRSMYATYERPVKVHGIDGLHYIADPKMLASGRDYLPNRCFCPPPRTSTDVSVGAENEMGSSPSSPSGVTNAEINPLGASLEPKPDEDLADGDTALPTGEGEGRRRREARRPMTPEEMDARDAQPCLPEGALDMTTCFGSPVILTLPHFYLGASEFSEYVTGVKADKRKHETFVDIEPLTGIPIRGGKRVQLNMFMTKIEQISVLSSVSEGLFPILWVQEGIELEGNSLEQLMSANRQIKALIVFPWVVLGLGAVLALAGAVLHAHDTGMFARVSMPEHIAGRGKGSKGSSSVVPEGEYPTGPPPGNYGYALGFGPPSPSFVWSARRAGLGLGAGMRARFGDGSMKGLRGMTLESIPAGGSGGSIGDGGDMTLPDSHAQFIMSKIAYPGRMKEETGSPMWSIPSREKQMNGK